MFVRRSIGLNNIGLSEVFQKLSETSDMASEGLGEMFEGDSADMWAGKFPLGAERKFSFSFI